MSGKGYLFVPLLAVALLGGCRTFYVDAGATCDPCDGSSSLPYRQIADATGAVTPGSDHNIKVRSGVYRESVDLPRGIDIYPWDDDQPAPVIIGPPGRPVITAGGHNVIRDLIIEGGSKGIRVVPTPTLEVTDSAYAYIWNNEIRSASSDQGSAHGIEVFVDMSAVSRPQRAEDRYIQLFIENNYIHDLDDGDGIYIELRGADTGIAERHEQGVLLDVKNNVVTSADNGINLVAQGVDLMAPAVTISGTVGDNLLVGNTADGLVMQATHAAIISPIIQYNTIAHNGSNGISANAPDSNVRAVLNSNLIAGNGGYGYEERSARTTVMSRHHNLFHANTSGHYFDFDDGVTVNTADDLNRIRLPAGGFDPQEGNLVSDPLWQTGLFYWMGSGLGGQPASYFLQQNGVVSPAVDGGDTNLLSARGLHGRTTSIDGIANSSPLRVDTGTADIGFHYSTAH